MAVETARQQDDPGWGCARGFPHLQRDEQWRRERAPRWEIAGPPCEHTVALGEHGLGDRAVPVAGAGNQPERVRPVFSHLVGDIHLGCGFLTGVESGERIPADGHCGRAGRLQADPPIGLAAVELLQRHAELGQPRRFRGAHGLRRQRLWLGHVEDGLPYVQRAVRVVADAVGHAEFIDRPAEPVVGADVAPNPQPPRRGPQREALRRRLAVPEHAIEEEAHHLAVVGDRVVMPSAGADRAEARGDLLVGTALGVRHGSPLVVNGDRRGNAAIHLEVEAHILPGHEAATVGAILVQPALHGDLLEALNGLGRLAVDTVVLAVEPKRAPEPPANPRRPAQVAVVPVGATVGDDVALALIEVIQKERVVIWREWLKGRRGLLPESGRGRHHGRERSDCVSHCRSYLRGRVPPVALPVVVATTAGISVSGLQDRPGMPATRARPVGLGARSPQQSARRSLATSPAE